MSLATELLDGIIGIGDYILINDDKTITVPNSAKLIAVQYDHNVNTVTFKCSRWWNDLDLSTTDICVHCVLPNGNTVTFDCVNISVDEEDDSLVLFDWIITEDATQLYGVLTILICARLTDNDGAITKRWHTKKNYDLYIDEGIECAELDVDENPNKLNAPVIYLETVEDGGSDEPDEPTTPTKLEAPVIYLETVEDGGSDEGGDSTTQTPAILGLAILGRTILGVTDVESGDDSEDPVTPTKLEAPVIYLETVEDDSGDDTEDPVIPTKLEMPVIYLETVEDEVTPTKLDAPEIYLETVEEEHTHTYTSEVTAPTCTEQGYTTHTCPECGDTYKDSYTEALGHTEVVDNAVDPTCTETGLSEGKHCSVCNETIVEQTVVDALGHSFGEPYYSDEFTTGYGRKCERCGELEELEAPLEKLATPEIYLEEVDENEIVLFDADVTTAKTSFTVGGMNMSGVTIISNEVLLEPYTLGYTLTIDGVEYILDFQIGGYAWADDNLFSANCNVAICTDGSSTAINTALLGEDDEVHHVKISYKEGDLTLPKLETPAIYVVGDSIPSTTISITDDTLAWTRVEEATYYDIYANGNRMGSAFGTTQNLIEWFDNHNYEAGEYTITVKAVSYGTPNIESEHSNSIIYNYTI